MSLARWSPSRPVLASGQLGLGNQSEASGRRSAAQLSCAGWKSHLHLALHQVGPELLSCAGDLPLVSQQVDAQVLDVSTERGQTELQNGSTLPTNTALRRTGTRSRCMFAL